jgi:hypothetical protein
MTAQRSVLVVVTWAAVTQPATLVVLTGWVSTTAHSAERLVVTRAWTVHPDVRVVVE